MVRHAFERTMAVIMGKRMFDQGEASWPEEAPFHTPVYVLTHEKRAPWVRPGGTTLHFEGRYSLDELLATGQFMRRRKRAGRSLLVVIFTGDTDEDSGVPDRGRTEFEQDPVKVLRDAVGGNVDAPWNLLACIAIGAWLMLTVGADGIVLSSLACGVALVAMSIPRGPVRQRNGAWNRLLV